MSEVPSGFRAGRRLAGGGYFLLLFRDFDFPVVDLRLLALVLRPPVLVFALLAFVGSFFRFVPANSLSCFSLIDFAIPRDAPFSADFDTFPRFAARAAPAAFCCFLDLAGIPPFMADKRASGSIATSKRPPLSARSCMALLT